MEQNTLRRGCMLSAACVLAIVGGCAASSSQKELVRAAFLGRELADAGDFQQIVEGAIPIGTPVEDAQRLLEKDDFECVVRRPSVDRDADRNRDKDAPRARPPYGDSDYIYASKSETIGFMVSREYRVVLRIDAGGIAEIRANYGLVGP